MWFSSHQPIVCYANAHQERALFFHGSKGGPESLWRQPFSLQSLPRRAWECSLPLGLLFIYFLLRITEWAMVIVVGHERITYLYRTWGQFRPKLTELNAGQIWESCRRPSRAGVSTSPPLTFGARYSVLSGGGGGACRVRGKVLSSFSGLCPIDTSSTSPVMIAKNVSRYCLIKTSSVEYHWSGAIPVPHLADRKLSPAEGDKPSQSYSYSASAGVETRTQDPHGSHTQGQRAALLSFADCSVGFCFYFCFSSSSMSDPSISCFHFIVPFLSFCFSYCITEINPSLGNREVQKEGDKEHSAAPR